MNWTSVLLGFLISLACAFGTLVGWANGYYVLAVLSFIAMLILWVILYWINKQMYIPSKPSPTSRIISRR